MSSVLAAPGMDGLTSSACWGACGRDEGAEGDHGASVSFVRRPLAGEKVVRAHVIYASAAPRESHRSTSHSVLIVFKDQDVLFAVRHDMQSLYLRRWSLNYFLP